MLEVVGKNPLEHNTAERNANMPINLQKYDVLKSIVLKMAENLSQHPAGPEAKEPKPKEHTYLSILKPIQNHIFRMELARRGQTRPKFSRKFKPRPGTVRLTAGIQHI